MKGIVITTDGSVSVKDFEKPLYKTVGAAVGGYIEIVHPRELPRPYLMIVNKAGLLQNLALNGIGSVLYGTPAHGQPIVGHIVIMKDGFVNGEPDIVGLDDKEIHEMLLPGLKAASDLAAVFFPEVAT